MDVDPNLERLRAQLDSPAVPGRTPLALVGAGVSVPMGYPTWKGLIEKLHERLISPSPALQTTTKDARQSGKSWYSALKTFDKDPLWQAEAYEQALPKGGLAAFIKENFAQKPLGEAHTLLGRLKFRHYLTTNFDPSIEESLKLAGRFGGDFTWRQKSEVTKLLLSLHTGDGDPRVAHLHGKYDDGDSLVLTEKQYVDRYVLDEDARRKLLAIFLTYPVVFVGFSLDDPDLSQIMREVAARLGELDGAVHHYGIFGFRTLPEKEAIQRRMRDKFGMSVIFYEILTTRDPRNRRRKIEDHSGLLEILRYLDTGERPPPGYASKRREEIDAIDAADTQKGRWGGLEAAGGFRVTVEKLAQEGRSWVEFALVVTREDGAAFTDDAVFHLHDSFTRSKVTVKVTDKPEARLVRWAFGAFTVGVELKRSGVRLEIDLAEKDVFPAWFRDN